MQLRNSFNVLVPLLGAMAALSTASAQALVVTASNASANQLLVYSTAGRMLQAIPTEGQGGVSGNSGGIASQGSLVAVVNYGSQSVSLFSRGGARFGLLQVMPTIAKPVSVAFGNGHLYVLGATQVASYWMFESYVSPAGDGMTNLLLADGSAGQVGVVQNQLIITEKNNGIETVNLAADGSITGGAVTVQAIPSNVNTPFGMATRGNNAYVTIAHADETALVRNGQVLTVTASGTQHSPCWLALDGPFLYSANSPSMSISRYAVYGQKLVLDGPVVAQTKGAPTDIAAASGLVAVIDGANGITHLSIFSADEDGNLTLKSAANINGAANGVAIVTNGN
jgi:hypothetical protein